MPPYRVGIIGCGRPRSVEGATGFGMSNAHAEGYKASPDAEIVALADISRENALAFQANHGGDNLYDDYHVMLTQEDLDIVSISTWPHLHAEMTIAAARAGVKAVHCEKPMALTFGDCRAMVQICDENHVQLTFNHQRRFGAPFVTARELLRSGAIGDLQRMEAYCPNLYDWGTHWFDMLFFYNDEVPADWVIGQFDIRESTRVFGALIEGQGVSHFKFQNDVYGMLITGRGAAGSMINRLTGTDGVIEVGGSREEPLRMWGRGQSGWTSVTLDGGMHDTKEQVTLGVLDLIDALQHGREPELSGHRALRATELIFGTYESSRRRGRVDLPLDIDDSPLLAMVESGEIVAGE